MYIEYHFVLVWHSKIACTFLNEIFLLNLFMIMYIKMIIMYYDTFLSICHIRNLRNQCECYCNLYKARVKMLSLIVVTFFSCS